MIGVIANPSEEPIVREFFELFKTPWEFYRGGVDYEVVLCSDRLKRDGIEAKVLLAYSGLRTDFDVERNVPVESETRAAELSFLGKPLPIYGNVVVFRHGNPVLTEEGSRRPVIHVDQSDGKVFVRVGYDLFYEVEHLLVKGQPAEKAAVPTLDRHIELLRELIVSSGIPLVEIPPVPHGYPFIVCLTHDLDHALIRRHGFDSTILGFLYRATLGSAINAARGRYSFTQLLTNLAAAFKLPFIHLGLAKDIWYEFDRYLELENGRPSTFFVVPIENYPGRTANGQAPRARATRYDVSHIAEKIPRLMAAGCEIGLHGLDAWLSTPSGRQEAGRISAVTGKSVLGIRMHWLYFDERSPDVLEEADFSYDSTVGYNNTVGYRAGTHQVFKPLSANRLLELPLHIMDTAMFYPHYLDLSEAGAWDRLSPVFDNVFRTGGVLTINWHDRSISPERLWANFYVRLLNELTTRGAWFSTASQAASWFRKRRSAVFVQDSGGEKVLVTVGDESQQVPDLRLRFHRPREMAALGGTQADLRQNYSDTPFSHRIDFCFPN